jgi:O-antigen/teichoic acid export membrane protein
MAGGGGVNFLLAWAVSFLYIFLKSTQQRQVQFAEYRKMPIPSYGMAFCEVFVTSVVVRHYNDAISLVVLAICIGTGAWMGSMLGTYLHARRRK